MPESIPPPTAERRPAWRVTALAYRQARRERMSHDAAMNAAEASLREQWPALSAEEASAEVVAAIAYASSHHPAWFWERGRRQLNGSPPVTTNHLSDVPRPLGCSSPPERGCATAVGHPNNTAARATRWAARLFRYRSSQGSTRR
jgi:hypothetical protein